MVEKNKKQQDAKKRRNTWTISPITKVKESKKKYNRKKEKSIDKYDFV